MDTQQIDRDLAEKVMGAVIVTLTEPIPIDRPAYFELKSGKWKMIDRGHSNPRYFSPSTSRDDAHEVLAKLTATPAQISEAVWMATC